MNESLSVVIPAYNEATRLRESLLTVLDYLEQLGEDSELIVVDDGSSDDTAAIAVACFARARRASTRLLRIELNRGKGFAVRTGLLAARAPVALFSDADLSTPITEAPKMLQPIRHENADIVFGSRDRRLIEVRQPWHREQSGRAFNLVVKLATGLPFHDTQCGFKAFRMTRCRPIIEAAVIDRFGFDVEILYVAHLAGLSLREQAVRWDHNAGSKVTVMKDSFRMLNEVRAIRRNVLTNRYDFALYAVRQSRPNPGLQQVVV